MRRKKRNFEAEIAEVQEKLKKAEGRVKELQKKMRALMAERDAEVHQALNAVMGEKHLTIDDVLKLVKASEGKEADAPKEKKGKGK